MSRIGLRGGGVLRRPSPSPSLEAAHPEYDVLCEHDRAECGGVGSGLILAERAASERDPPAAGTCILTKEKPDTGVSTCVYAVAAGA